MSKGKKDNAAVVEVTNEKKVVKEYAEVFVRLYPEYEGEGDLVRRDMRFPEISSKFAFGLPFPKTDEDCVRLYGCTKDVLARHGLRQLSYDCDSDTKNVLGEKIAAGYKPEELVGDAQKEHEAEFFTERARKATGGAKALVKEVKAAEKELGMSYAEQIAFIKAHMGK